MVCLLLASSYLDSIIFLISPNSNILSLYSSLSDSTSSLVHVVFQVNYCIYLNFLGLTLNMKFYAP